MAGAQAVAGSFGAARAHRASKALQLQYERRFTLRRLQNDTSRVTPDISIEDGSTPRIRLSTRAGHHRLRYLQAFLPLIPSNADRYRYTFNTFIPDAKFPFPLRSRPRASRSHFTSTMSIKRTSRGRKECSKRHPQYYKKRLATLQALGRTMPPRADKTTEGIKSLLQKWKA